MELAIGFSILAIVLSLPALFLAVYAIVCIKGHEYAKELQDQEINAPASPQRPMVAEELYGESDSAPSPYDFNDEDEPQSIEDYGV